MPLISRYSIQTKGAMTFTGNTVGLSKLGDNLKAGTLGSIGAFISLDEGLQVPTFPVGTTLNIDQNGSAAQLSLPVGSIVRRAELIWGGSYYYQYQPKAGGGAVADLTSQINQPVYLTSPSSGGRIQIQPDPDTAQVDSFSYDDGSGQRTVRWYMRSADVTEWVTETGTYSVERIVGLLEARESLSVATNHAGWTLAVVYENAGMIERNLYLWIGAQIVERQATPQVDIPIIGFQTKPSGTISARLLLSVQEGDANITGDRMYFGPTSNSLTNVFGPNNPINNFFVSQINDDTGNLNTTGTFGTLNATASNGTQIVAGRQGWDITNIDVSAQMVNNQTSAVIRLTTTGDAYMINSVGMQLDVLRLDAHVIKSVDKQYADLGETLTYTVKVTNQGNVPMTRVVLTDELPNGLTYVAHSVTVNQVVDPSQDPVTGIELGDLAIERTVEVTFKVLVTGLPTVQPVMNLAKVSYNYAENLRASAQSELVPTWINHASIQITKFVDKAYEQLGEQLIYTTTLSNTGTTAATSVWFQDTLPVGVLFVVDSVKVDGIALAGENPSIGFGVADIPVGRVRVVSFAVQVQSVLPQVNPLMNTSQTSYQYRVDPSGEATQVNGRISNTVSTQINQAILVLQKSASQSQAGFGEIFSYTTTLTNVGNVKATQIGFIDSVPDGLSFVPGTVVVDGVEQPNFNPNIGWLLEELGGGESRIVSFQVKVEERLPGVNPIPNVSGARYAYWVDPLGSMTLGNPAISNEVLVQIEGSLLTATKAVDQAIVGVDGQLIYSITIENRGNVAAVGVVCQDSLPTGTQFMVGSVRIDGVGYESYDPEAGFVVPPLASHTSMIITFGVKVEGTLPIPAVISNTASIQLLGKPIIYTNTVETTIKHAQIQVFKQVDHTSVDLSHVIQYTLTLTNVGNTTAQQVVLKDSLPPDTTFIVGSVWVEGVSKPLANPVDGIVIGEMLAGEVIIVIFDVVVKNTLPVQTPIQNQGWVDYQYSVNPLNPPVIVEGVTSNVVSSVLNTARISTLKQVDRQVAGLGDRLFYTMIVSNTGTTKARRVILYDVIPAGTVLVADSVSVGGVVQPGAQPGTGIQIGTLAAGESISVSFSVVIEQNMPPSNPITNRSTTAYDYLVEPLGALTHGPASSSNVVHTQINHAGLNLEKLVSEHVATLGDHLTYTIKLTQVGNVDAEDIILTDRLPSGAVFVPNSVTREGVSIPGADPEVGIAIGSLAVGESITIAFEGIIGNTLPDPNPMRNIAGAVYGYEVVPGELLTNAQANSNSVETLVSEQQDFAKITAIKTVDEAYSQLGAGLTYEIVLTNTGNTAALDVMLVDTLQAGITFVQGSVVVGLDARPDDDIQQGVQITTLAVGESVRISFKVTIDQTLPIINPISNTAVVNYSFKSDPDLSPIQGPSVWSNAVKTMVYAVNVGGKKSVNLEYADRGDILIYTLGVANLGTATLKQVKITDSTPAGTVFIPGSVTIDGQLAPLANLEEGIIIDTILPNSIQLVIYKVQVIDQTPQINPIINTAEVAYKYTLNPAEPDWVGQQFMMNPVSTQINHGEVELTKQASLAFADWNQEVTYTITARNRGNVAVTQLKIVDRIPVGMSFVRGSVIVGGESLPLAQPDEGIIIEQLAVAAHETISFRVKVMSGFSATNPIPNEANSEYSYKVDPLGLEVLGKSKPSDTVFVQVNHGALSLSKVQDKDAVDLGEILTYTLIVSNIGNIAVSEMRLVDTIPQGLEWVTGSTVVGGIEKPLEDPNNGIIIQKLDKLEQISVVFDVRVMSLTSQNPVENSAQAQYTYQINPMDETTRVTDQVVSPSVWSRINHAQIQLHKSVSQRVVGMGERITYTILVENTGTTKADDVTVEDSIPVGTQFVPGSVVIAGVAKPLEQPELGIALGSIEAGKIVPISFSVDVANQLPVSNPINNQAKASYVYRVRDNEPPISVPERQSNVVSTQVNGAQILIEKAVSTRFADWGEILVYQIKATNKGNVSAIDMMLIDEVPRDTYFIAGSVWVGTERRLDANPNKGIELPDLLAGESIDVIFEVQVADQNPIDNPITNVARLQYQYRIEPNSAPMSALPVVSEVVQTQVNTGKIDIQKTADHFYKDIGEIITYTFTLTHLGNVEATQLVLRDLLAPETEFVLGSITVGGESRPLAQPDEGIVIADMSPGESVVVTLQAVVVELPKAQIIENKGILDYAYRVDPQGPLVLKQESSNQVELTILHAMLVTVKSVSQQTVQDGDRVTYQLVITNTGNTQASEILVQDSLGVGLTWIPGSVKVDGRVLPQANPELGIPIQVIGVGQTRTVSFEVRVGEGGANPIPNRMYTTYGYKVDPTHPFKVAVAQSNLVNLVNKRVQISLIKSADQVVAVVGDEVVYSLQATNTGEVDLGDVIIKDLLEEQLIFIAGSVMIQGKTYHEASLLVGVSIGTLAIGETKGITFRAKVKEKVKAVITNRATSNLFYQLEGENQWHIRAQNSNELNIMVEEPRLILIKEVEEQIAQVGQVLRYRISAVNTGDLALMNILIKDTLPPMTQLVQDSLKLNGISIQGGDLEKGIHIGRLDVGSEANLTYQVSIVGSSCTGELTNRAIATYSYESSEHRVGEGVTAEVSTKVQVRESSFKQVGMHMPVKLPCQKPDMLEVDEIVAEVKGLDYYVIRTMAGISHEGQKLSGYKLMIQGDLELTLTYYTSQNERMHSAYWQKPFTSFVILPSDYVEGMTINVLAQVEEAEGVLKNTRELDVEVLLLLIARV